jgi:uncharacterized protein (DUF433 family)/DNA-binding transcriptional MerR regulator
MLNRQATRQTRSPPCSFGETGYFPGMTMRQTFQVHELFGVGSYTVLEAARLIGVAPRNISRWMKGYSFKRKSVEHHVPPLWPSQWPLDEDHIEIGFRDLIELRFVKAFLDAGMGLLAVRNCLDYARQCVQDDRPFSTRRFQTDGNTIFLESVGQHPAESSELLDLKRKQYVFKQVIERTFKDLDIEDDAVARWRPYKGKQSIVIDPQRSFGQPIAFAAGVPTVVLAQAVEAEGSVERVARLYEVAAAVVRDAVRFESTLQAA